MALDLFSSVRSTAVITLVAASFSSPIVVKSDAFASATAKLTGKEQAQPEQLEQLVAGGVEFEMPESWGRLGARAASHDEGESERIGTVVTGVCPGGSAGAECADATSLTFVAYSGEDGHELPVLTEFEDQLDAQLAREFAGFRPSEAATRPAGDGTRYLDYTFTWGTGKVRHVQRIAAYRHGDGAGLVVMAAGPKLADHTERIDEFLSGAHLTGGGSH